jgi:hypothetical protein
MLLLHYKFPNYSMATNKNTLFRDSFSHLFSVITFEINLSEIQLNCMSISIVQITSDCWGMTIGCRPIEQLQTMLQYKNV